MLKNTVSLVTGGASGLGKGTVERLVQCGSSVVFCDLPTSDGKIVADSLKDVTFIPTDISKESDVQNMVNTIKSKYGKLDHIINCAGISCAYKVYNFKKNLPHKYEDFTRIVNVNLCGTFNVIRLAVSLIGMNEPNKHGQRGVIINTASIAAYEGQIGQVAYAASKAGIVGMTLPLARDLSVDGIRVCTIAPGLFDTPLLSMLPQKVVAYLQRSVPFPRRFGQSSEFAQLVLSIIENPMINGEVIRLDGALRMQ